MHLTEEQQRAIETGQVVDIEVDGRRCALLSWEAYERVRDAEEHPSSEATAKLIRETMAEDDADDPLLEGYQQYKRGS